MARAKPETPGPGPSAIDRELELLVGVVSHLQNLEADIQGLRAHLERRGAAGPVGVRVMACLLNLGLMQEVLCQLQIVALGEMTE